MRTSRRLIYWLGAITLIMFWAATPALCQSNDIVVQDIFGRRLNEFGLVLVDWEGYIANPAIKFYVTPPAMAAFPASAVLSVNNPRLYFELPSQVGASGPTKTITFPDATSRVPVLLSNFPDRDTVDDNHLLTIQFTGADGAQISLTLNVHEIDQDKTDPAPYKVTVDFSKDQTGFFADPQKRQIIQQAADDWAYFIGDMNLDAVSAGTETTFIWDQMVLCPAASLRTGILILDFFFTPTEFTAMHCVLEAKVPQRAAFNRAVATRCRYDGPEEWK